MKNLSNQNCVPCQEGATPMTEEEARGLQSQLHADWDVVDGHHLMRTFRFANFAEALAFTNDVGAIAEAEDHHPDIYLAWGQVRVEIWTHKIDGLTQSDFVLAAKVDEI